MDYSGVTPLHVSGGEMSHLLAWSLNAYTIFVTLKIFESLHNTICLPPKFCIFKLLLKSSRTRFPCLHSRDINAQGVGRILPTPRVFISGYANTGKQFSIALNL